MQVHHALEKILGGLVVREERVALDVIELAAVGRWAPTSQRRRRRGRVQAEQPVEPFFNLRTKVYARAQGQPAVAWRKIVRGDECTGSLDE
jgi:hypothetical protein